MRAPTLACREATCVQFPVTLPAAIINATGQSFIRPHARIDCGVGRPAARRSHIDASAHPCVSRSDLRSSPAPPPHCHPNATGQGRTLKLRQNRCGYDAAPLAATPQSLLPQGASFILHRARIDCGVGRLAARRSHIDASAHPCVSRSDLRSIPHHPPRHSPHCHPNAHPPCAAWLAALVLTLKVLTLKNQAGPPGFPHLMPAPSGVQ